MSLGHWAVIDIETTGINPGNDAIIDLGFYQFEGTKLIKTFSSLVRSEFPISPFITKLTGITNDQVMKAPVWEKVEHDLLELEKHSLVAHNAGFEESFLKKYFDKVEKGSTYRETYQDSILFFGLLFPEFSTLNLEVIMNHLQIAEKEEHRGLADSRDLLKAMLVATYMSHQDREFRVKLSEEMREFPDEFWFKHFFALDVDELDEVAAAIDFPLKEAYKKYKDSLRPVSEEQSSVKVDFSQEFNGQNIQHILRDEANVKKILPHYKHREAQEQLALRVGQSFKNGIHSLVQAPTGTGKTMGYLLPSALFSLKEKRTVLMATGTKTLQDQAIQKDIPQIRKLLNLSPDQFKVVRLVGSSNHLCELLFRENEEQASLTFQLGAVYTKAYYEMFFFHNSRASYDRKSTRDQIPFILKKLIPEISEKENEIAVDYRACAGQNCPFVNQCSYVQGLREAKEANLIVGNHALLLHWPRSLPRPEYVVVDEAHKIESEGTKAFSIEVTQKNLEIFFKALPQGMGALIYLLNSMEDEFKVEDTVARLRQQTTSNTNMARDHFASLPQIIESWFKKLPNYTPAYMNELPLPKDGGTQDVLATAILNHIKSLEFIFSELFTLYFPFISRWEIKDLKEDKNKIKAWAVFESMFGQLEKLCEAFKHYIDAPKDWVGVLQYSENDGYTMSSSPIDVGRKIFDELLTPSHSVVFTSATLANAAGDAGFQGVEWMTGYTYLPSDKRFKSGLFLDAVYDYKNNSKVYLSSDTRNLSDPMFVPDLLEGIAPVIDALGGRTLLLFSSRLRFDMAADLILKKYEGRIPVFIQGLGKNVVEEFKKEEAAILIGMETFGEGIDIPGDKLQFIVVDKIPDLRQDLVIQKRRDFFEFKFSNEFTDYFLANRTRSLHQKFGRLLRTESDHGAILVIDNRVKKWKGNTFKSFIKLMEPYQISHQPLKEACESIKTYFKAN